MLIDHSTGNWDRFEFTVAQHYLPAIINGDYSGDYSTADLGLLQTFMYKAIWELPDNCDSSHWADFGPDCNTNFARCEVSGLLADVADIALVFRTKESE